MSDFDLLVRPEVAALTPYNAGLSLDEVNARYAPERISKLGSNENPHGPSPKVRQALAATLDQLHLYPDSTGGRLRQAIAGMIGLASADRIVLGNGSEDLISVICRTVLRPGDRVVTLYPSFPLHEDYATTQGAIVDRIGLTDDLEIDLHGLISAVGRPSRLVMFANPMNPSGNWLDAPALQKVVDATHPQSLLVVDEAYLEYAAGDDYPDTLAMLEKSGRPWVILRTFSKAYGLAGLRIGYAIASDPALADIMNRVRTPFNANALAQRAAVIAIDDQEHVRHVVAETLSERTRLSAVLQSRGYRIAPSKCNFLFFDTGRIGTGVAERLLRQGVIIKPWKQPGYERFIRVSIGLPVENDHFLDSLED